MTIQSVFYILSSVVIVVVGILLVVTIYYLMGILRDTRNVFDDIKFLHERIKSMANFFLPSKKRKKRKK